ncbi:MAG: DEAD/DEAH box helicase [Candidatus Aenigmarchaeota archaeon]|nr:DEAD/DEAH box helicase [Candidatus Aenigmarchaeota archaeon]
MNFEDLHLKPELLKAVRELEFTELTEIQEKSIPEIQAGKDIVGQSSTGSGKTAAFGLPILQKIEHGKGIQALILTPTRELCVQVTDALRSFAKYTNVSVASVFGGVSIEPQVNALRNADVIVGTPGRILDHTERRTINYQNVRFLVIDEADKMFEMGFIEDVEKIIRHIPNQRQTMLFSATMPSEVRHIVEKHLISPVTIKGIVYVDTSLLRQVYYDVKPHDKFSLLVHLLKQNKEGIALVFCATRREADAVAFNLKEQGINAMAIHGGMEQNKRLKSVEALKNETINVLVATDVAARGLDIRNVSHVYNYDVPKTSSDYIHRVGRTARAGGEGDAVTLLSERDHGSFTMVLRDRSLKITRSEKPGFERVPFKRSEGREGGFRKHNFRRPSFNRRPRY